MGARRSKGVALLCIDMQQLGCSGEFVSPEQHGAIDTDESTVADYLETVSNHVVPNIRRLQQAFRHAGHEVIHTRIQSLTRDGRDRSLEHKRLSIHAPPGSTEAQFVPEVAPAEDEIVLNKTASGVFLSTNLEYVLRNLEVQHLYVCGVYTNECISSAVRGAADLGFDVRLIRDATAALTQKLHDATLLIVHGRYGRVMTTDEALQELRRTPD